MKLLLPGTSLIVYSSNHELPTLMKNKMKEMVIKTFIF